MCNFFSFVTDPVNHPAEYYYFDWEYRKAHMEEDGADSHSHICKMFKLDEDVCNKYEFNPLTGEFIVDQINSERDDREVAEKWVNKLDFKTVVEPLIVKPIVNPFELPAVERVTDEQIDWLKSWASVWDLVLTSVRASVGASVWASVRDSVGASVGASVRRLVIDSVWNSVWISVWDSVWASVMGLVSGSIIDLAMNSVLDLICVYATSMFDVKNNTDFSSAIKLWESGLVPSFDGTTWRLHSGKNADVVYEWTPEVQE